MTRLNLIVVKGSHQGLSLSTDELGIYHIGRNTDAHLALTRDEHVSRKHCSIELTPTGALIRDVSSRSGTFVNKKRIQEVLLSNGDTILIGRTILRISLSGTSTPATTSEHTSPVPGFTLVKRLPTVGPGKVYWAVAEPANQLVMLHFLSLDEPVMTEDHQRFMRQAAICAKLSHPGLVRFLTQGITAETLWFATELTDGQNLQQFVSVRGSLSLKDALELLGQILDIVIYLHQQEVVHRSLRPESLIVKKEAGVFRVQLIDLGSAKCLQTAELQRITKLGQPSPLVHPFTAPEALIDFAKMDPRSDIYALSALIYFALTGCTPYENLTSEALITAILEQEPPPLTTLKSGLPMAVTSIVEKAMAKEVEQRYSTAQEMLAALQQVTSPIKDQPDQIQSLQKQLSQRQTNLNTLEEQAAMYSAGSVPLHLLNQIEEEKQSISQLKIRLSTV